ncbi:MAG: DoxX family membrane protein [Phycisphaeraceae bacterium]|nr:MAG: DoxX family membrane protein [Phycisphaeraceae bacterium]
MHLARSSAVYAAPVPLRLVLALTFIWAGLGKMVATFPVQGDQAALLANMGYSFPKAAPPAPTAKPGDPAKPDGSDSPNAPADPDAKPDATPGDDAPPPAAVPLVQPAPSGAQAAIAHTAAEFPEPIGVRRLYGIAIMTYQAAHPAANAGSTPQPIWPDWAARDHWPITLAWAVAVAEVVAGVFVLVGLLTRLSSLVIAGIMATAMWLTGIGPAIQSGDTLLGFLPHHDLWDIGAWQTMLWQAALVGSAIALLFAGPGAFALDRAGGRKRDDDFDEADEDEKDADA